MRDRKVAWEAPFLQALRTVGVVLTACQMAGVGRSSAYKRRRENERFRQRWDEAMDDALDALEVDLMRIARDQSDTVDASTKLRAITWTLARRRPATWGDREKVEVSGPEGGAVKVEHTYHTPDAETWARIIAIREEQEQAKGRGDTE